MFERFTDEAKSVVVLAREEARSLNHDQTGTGHILIALTRESTGIAAQALRSLGVTEESARQHAARSAGQSQQPGQAPFSPVARKTLELSMREAMALGDNQIGAEHILLGLIRADQSSAAPVLTGLGADPNRIRQQVLRLRPAPLRKSRRGKFFLH